MSEEGRQLGAAMLQHQTQRQQKHCERLTYSFSVTGSSLDELAEQAAETAAAFYGARDDWRITSMDVDRIDRMDEQQEPTGECVYSAMVWTELP